MAGSCACSVLTSISEICSNPGAHVVGRWKELEAFTAYTHAHAAQTRCITHHHGGCPNPLLGRSLHCAHSYLASGHVLNIMLLLCISLTSTIIN